MGDVISFPSRPLSLPALLQDVEAAEIEWAAFRARIRDCYHRGYNFDMLPTLRQREEAAWERCRKARELRRMAL